MRKLLIGIALSFVWVAPSLAQAPEPKRDSSAVQAIVARAKATGGAMWAEEAHFFCEAPRANSPNDPPIEPAMIFDNVAVIGIVGHGHADHSGGSAYMQEHYGSKIYISAAD